MSSLYPLFTSSRGPVTGEVSSKAINEQQVHAFLSGLFGPDVHAMRILSRSLSILGVIHAASLSFYAVGQALGMARGKTGKHGVKQVDRMLPNPALKVWNLFQSWVPFVIAERTEALIALDWTDDDADDQTPLVASLVTKHGRPTPLIWLTVQKSTLKGLRNEAEDSVILRLRELIPSRVQVTLLADRGFADQEMYTLLEQLGFAYVVRFRKIITVTSAQGEKKCAEEWVPKAGQLRLLRDAGVTAKAKRVGAVVYVTKKGMKEAWCLATSLTKATGAQIVGLYRRRFTLEESFRDIKDLRFGMGLSSMKTAEPDRRDRLLVVSAMACALMATGTHTREGDRCRRGGH